MTLGTLRWGRPPASDCGGEGSARQGTSPRDGDRAADEVVVVTPGPPEGTGPVRCVQGPPRSSRYPTLGPPHPKPRPGLVTSGTSTSNSSSSTCRPGRSSTPLSSPESVFPPRPSRRTGSLTVHVSGHHPPRTVHSDLVSLPNAIPTPTRPRGPGRTVLLPYVSYRHWEVGGPWVSGMSTSLPGSTTGSHREVHDPCRHRGYTSNTHVQPSPQYSPSHPLP